jgi:hypothetical protein
MVMPAAAVDPERRVLGRAGALALGQVAGLGQLRRLGERRLVPVQEAGEGARVRVPVRAGGQVPLVLDRRQDRGVVVDGVRDRVLSREWGETTTAGTRGPYMS